jgi:hypothetical protein
MPPTVSNASMAIKAIQESTPTIRRDLTSSLSIITVPSRAKMHDAPFSACRPSLAYSYVAQVCDFFLPEKKPRARDPRLLMKLTSRTTGSIAAENSSL